MRVLVIEPDSSTAEVVSFALAGGGMEPVRAQTARAGLEIALAGHVRAVVVDQALPDLAGFDVCRVIRDHGDLPVVMIAGCDREETVIRAFAAGADDILVKPLRLAELVARLQALLRRASRFAADQEQALERGPFRLDQSRLEVTMAGRRDPVRLTPLEAKLLGLLMVNANHVMTKARLQELIWGYQNDSSGDLLKTHVRHLRVKLEAMPSFPRYIQTINGVGYTFVLPKVPELPDLPDVVVGVAQGLPAVASS
ncbi:MAG: response regulator transcription factor [Candidatus Sericytochromatia bacterium]|nr:response regulator transcription factor [Candidatus Tanganyikabacteria bacterium]